MTAPELKPGEVWWALMRGVMLIASFIGAVVGLVTLSAPLLTRWLDDRLEPLADAIAANQMAIQSLATDVSDLNQQVRRIEGVPFIEHGGNGGLVRDPGPYRAGESVPMLFWMRRNLPCTADVEVRFVSAETGQIDPRYSSTVRSTRAPITREFGMFAFPVALPGNMEPGHYAYTAVLVPSPAECPQERPVTFPPSEFFEVVAHE